MSMKAINDAALDGVESVGEDHPVVNLVVPLTRVIFAHEHRFPGP